MNRLYILPAVVFLALMCFTVWLWFRVDRAEDAVWDAKMESIRWETTAHALEHKLDRMRR